MDYIDVKRGLIRIDHSENNEFLLEQIARKFGGEKNKFIRLTNKKNGHSIETKDMDWDDSDFVYDKWKVMFGTLDDYERQKLEVQA